MTAASTLIDLSDETERRKSASQQRKRPFGWQRDAARHYDEVSELRAACRWMADAQSRMRLFAAVIPEDPDQPPVPVNEAIGSGPWQITQQEADQANAILGNVKGTDGDIKEIQRTSGLNTFLQGEGWLVGTEEDDLRDDQNPNGENWRSCSVQELKVTPSGQWAIQPWENAYEDELEILDPDTTVLIRSYRRHPIWKTWPDGGMRPGNLICEEILLATQALMAALSSQLSSGILPIPDDLELEPDEDEELETDADSLSILMRRLNEHFATPRNDARSAAAYSPFLLSLPKDLIGVIKQIEIARRIDPFLSDWLTNLIHRLGIAMDMPPELLTGRADINHWNAWIIDEDGVRLHIEPYTHLLADAITSKLLVPRMKAAGSVKANRFLVWWDPSDVMAHPNQEQHVVDAFDRGEASPHALRTALRIPDEDAPTPAERKSMMEWKQGGKPTPQEGQPVDAGPKGTIIGAQVPAAHTPRALTAASGAPPRRSVGAAFAKIERQLMRDLLVYADGEVRRAVEKAAARVKSAAVKGKSSAEAAAMPPASELAQALGRDQTHALGLTDEQLFAGGFAALGAYFASRLAQARAQATAALQSAGAAPSDRDLGDWEAQASHHEVDGWALLSAALVGVAAPLLFGSPSEVQTQGELDITLAVPAGTIRDALSEAGGGPAADLPDTTGYLAAADFTDFLDGLPDFNRGGYVWEVGAPAHPFEPHADLDGHLVTGLDDPELAWDPGDFPFVSILWPGDHDYCQCAITPTGDVASDEELPPPEDGGE